MNAICDLEPVERLARFSWDWAPTLCQPEHGCANYHRTWSMVRLLELGGALPAGLDFFRRELGLLADAGKRRVLVSGGADTGVMALVVEAFRAAGVRPRITFVDRCETSCWQNRLFARELGLDADVRCMDAAQVDGEPVDAVVSHSFLHFFEGAKRQEVLRAWAGVLAPGGVILMSTPLAPNDAEWKRIPDPVAIEERRQALEASALRAGWPATRAGQLGSVAVAAWSVSPRRWPALTRESLLLGLAQAGFDLRSIDVAAPVGSPSNLGTPPDKRRERAEVVASRP